LAGRIGGRGRQAAGDVRRGLERLDDVFRRKLLRRERGGRAGRQGETGGQRQPGYIDHERLGTCGHGFTPIVSPPASFSAGGIMARRAGPECERGYTRAARADVTVVTEWAFIRSYKND